MLCSCATGDPAEAQGHPSRGTSPGPGCALLPNDEQPCCGFHAAVCAKPLPPLPPSLTPPPPPGAAAPLVPGCHPGAWLQVACESLGPAKKGGRVIGVDLQARRRAWNRMAAWLAGWGRRAQGDSSCRGGPRCPQRHAHSLPHAPSSPFLHSQETRRPDKFCDDRVTIVQGDARELGPAFWDAHAPGGFDVVLSDMCHWTVRGRSDVLGA